jgi:hypothetical protein
MHALRGRPSGVRPPAGRRRGQRRRCGELDQRWSSDVVTVVIPELVVRRWWQQLLHNQTALWLKARLLFREGTIVTSVPAHMLESGRTRTPVPRATGAATTSER